MKRYALVIGITNYTSPLNDLSKPANDAEAVAQVLEAHGDFEDIKLLTGKVTTSQLSEALKTLLQQQAVKNEALVYFTGHGIQIYGALGEAQAYLATSDLTIFVKDEKIIGQKCGINFSGLNELIKKSDLSSLVVLLDCCHSGELLERSSIEKTLTAFISKRDYCYITASRNFQEAYAKKSEQHSIFTTALLNGLSDKYANDEGKVTGYRLFDVISTELKNSGQEPIYMGCGSAITLVTYKEKIQNQTIAVKQECPYQGLQAFTNENKEFFFGRQQIVKEILAKLDEKNFVTVIGASGSGKSSVVRAGLIPELAKNDWHILNPIKPGCEPLSELKAIFKEFFPGQQQRQLKDLIEKNDSGLDAILANLPEEKKYLLFVDQFEELFTVCNQKEERQRFIELLTQVAKINNSRLAVVITIRADFIEPCLSYSALTNLIQTQAIYMPPLTGVDLKSAIEEPAKLQGHSIEEKLLFQILEDVGKEPGFLPLMEFALTQLWDKRNRQTHQLTLKEYQKLGGLKGALNLHADKVYEYRDYEQESPSQPRTDEEQEWIKHIFLRLIRTGNGEKDTRQRQPKDKLLNISLNQKTELSELIDGEQGLVKGRLLVTGDEQQIAWIDLAHEALMEGWERFGEWRQEERELMQLRDRVKDAFWIWKDHEQDSDFLISKGLLKQVHQRRLELESHLDFDTLEFIKTSEECEDESQREQEQLREEAAQWNNYSPYDEDAAYEEWKENWREMQSE
jgi:type II secretory pathway predicted ATPase ExeA